MLNKELQKLGFSSKQARAYLAALELGKASVTAIARKADIPRTSGYDVLRDLEKDGFVSKTKRGKKELYVAESPSVLKQKLENRQEKLKAIMPELLSITNMISNKPTIRYFDGENGLQHVYLDTLNYPDQEMLAWVSDDVKNYFDVEWLENDYVPKRLEKKIWVRSIGHADSNLMQQYKDQSSDSLRKTRLVEDKDKIFTVEIILYGSKKVGVIAFQEQTAVIIESKKIYDTLKSIFEIQWENLSGQ